MNAYVVEFILRSVVVAEDEAHAHCVAESVFREIARDEDPDVSVDREIHSRHDLPLGWDVHCIPYGGDNNTNLEELLAERAAPHHSAESAGDQS